jgi:hypothetical protein
MSRHPKRARACGKGFIRFDEESAKASRIGR